MADNYIERQYEQYEARKAAWEKTGGKMNAACMFWDSKGNKTLSYNPESRNWKAVRVKDEDTIRMVNQFQADKLLLDSFTAVAYGGSGKVANWKIIQTAKIEKPFFLAGGLTEQNIVEGIKTVQPYGIDLSGGIETDGCKDRNKIAKIIEQNQKKRRFPYA